MADGVTVVVPTKNRWQYLQASLAMILRQTYDGPMEVVLVIDGGTDETAERIEALGDARIRVVRNPTSGGVSAARNAGLEVATHPWVAFCDDDDLWSLTKLELQMAAVEATDDECWCAGASVLLYEDWTVVGMRQVPPTSSDVGRLSLSDNPIPGGGSGVLAATALVRRVGGFDPTISLLADWDLWIRLAAAAPFVPVEEILLGYVLHPSSMSLDAGKAMEESDVIRDRYARDRAEVGVAHFGGARHWIASNYARAGEPMTAVRMYVKLLWETRRVRHLQAIASVLCGPALRRRLPARLKGNADARSEAIAFASDLRDAVQAAQLAVGFHDATWPKQDSLASVNDGAAGPVATCAAAFGTPLARPETGRGAVARGFGFHP